jgi:hypothetical protein
MRLTRETWTVPPLASLLLLTLVAIPVAAGCDDSDSSGEPADRPVEPPAGWRTVTNDDAGLTTAAPRSWTARTKRAATILRSGDRLVTITFAVDRRRAGRETPVGQYARQTFESLPDLEASLSASPRRVRGSPYRSARLDGVGRIRTSRRGQRISVASFRRPGRVTCTAVVFRNPRIDPGFHARAIDRVLSSLRLRPPEGSLPG